MPSIVRAAALIKAFKKNFSCNGALNKDEEGAEIIQLSGDQRVGAKVFYLYLLSFY